MVDDLLLFPVVIVVAGVLHLVEHLLHKSELLLDLAARTFVLVPICFLALHRVVRDGVTSAEQVRCEH